MEKPRRLKPTSEVTRALYLASGNRCAYPGCDRALMGADGVLVGEIVHIRAALPEGARFDESMTNESRRAYDNLMLMCGSDHTVIDADEATWTVEKLQELKAAHEAIYTNAVDLLRSRVGDVTEGTAWISPVNLVAVLGTDHGHSDCEMTANIAAVDAFAGRLAALPIGARSVIAVALTRGELAQRNGKEAKIPMSLLKNIVDCSESVLMEYLEIIEHAELGCLEEPFSGDPWEFYLSNSTGGLGWPLFAEIKRVAGDDAKVVRQVLVDLDFSPLDA